MDFQPGDVVRCWYQGKARYGTYVGTVERTGRRFGWRRVMIGTLRNGKMVPVERRIPPDKVFPVDSPSE